MDQAMFAELLKDYLVPAVPGETMSRIISAQADEDMRPLDLAPILATNPAYTQFLLSLGYLSQKVADWEAEDPERIDKERVFLSRILGLLGKTAVRNLIVSTRLARVMGTGLPRSDKDRFNLDPRTQLALALKAEELCESKGWVHPESGFVGGAHYDWLKATLTLRKAPKDAIKIIDECYTEGLRMGWIAYEVSRRLRSVEHDRLVVAGAMVIPIGKALMAAYFPKGAGKEAWVDFVAECDKKGALKLDAFDLWEERRFGVTHTELSALYLSAFGLARAVEPAVRFCRKPWLLAVTDPNQYCLAMTFSVAQALVQVSDWSSGEAGALRNFHRRWLMKNNIEPNALIDGLKAIGADKELGAK